MTHELQVALYTEIDATLHSQWLGLFAKLEQKNLFQHPAWSEAFIEHLHRADRHGQLLVAVALQHDQAVALFPLLYRRERRGLLTARVIELLHPTDMGVRDLLIANEADPQAVFDSILRRALPAAGYPWDIVELSDVAANSNACRAFEQLRTRGKLATYHHDSNRLRCSDDRAQSFCHISKSHIKKTKRKLKNLTALGRIEYALVQNPAELPQAMAAFIALENAGWKGTAGQQSSLHHDLPQKGFYEFLAAHPGESLNFCIAEMRLDEKLIASKLCTITGDTLWMLKITYDDNYHSHSPGNLLIMHLLELFAGHPQVKYINFVTSGDWTLRWHPEQTPVYNCRLFARTSSGLTGWLTGRAIATARKMKHFFSRLQAAQTWNRKPDERNQSED